MGFGFVYALLERSLHRYSCIEEEMTREAQPSKINDRALISRFSSLNNGFGRSVLKRTKKISEPPARISCKFVMLYSYKKYAHYCLT